MLDQQGPKAWPGRGSKPKGQASSARAQGMARARKQAQGASKLGKAQGAARARRQARQGQGQARGRAKAREVGPRGKESSSAKES